MLSIALYVASTGPPPSASACFCSPSIDNVTRALGFMPVSVPTLSEISFIRSSAFP